MNLKLLAKIPFETLLHTKAATPHHRSRIWGAGHRLVFYCLYCFYMVFIVFMFFLFSGDGAGKRNPGLLIFYCSFAVSKGNNAKEDRDGKANVQLTEIGMTPIRTPLLTLALFVTRTADNRYSGELTMSSPPEMIRLLGARTNLISLAPSR